MSEKNNSVDSNTGTKIYNGSSEITKGNHDHMPKRDASYLPTDERGHIQASSLSGDNSKENIAPQAKDLNHGAYLSVEKGEKDALKNGNTIESEKMAVSSGAQPGNRPDAFLVNDVVTTADGHTQEIHHSFANMMNDEQENLNKELDKHSDMLNAPNPEDTLRERMSVEEYADMMEKTDAELPGIRDEYQVDEYTSSRDDFEVNKSSEEDGEDNSEEDGMGM